MHTHQLHPNATEGEIWFWISAKFNNYHSFLETDLSFSEEEADVLLNKLQCHNLKAKVPSTGFAPSPLKQQGVYQVAATIQPVPQSHSAQLLTER